MNMNRIASAYRIIGIMVIAAAALVLLLWSMGYYIDKPGWEVGIIAADKGDPRICLKLKVLFNLFGPTGPERRAECIYTYAELSTDPKVCELLFPNEYGLACLSNVWGRLFKPLPCVKVDGKTWLTCDDEGSESFLTIDHPQIADCNLYERKDVREWCYSERSSYIHNIYQCNNIGNQSVRDNCEKNYAFKQKDPARCSAIKDEKRRKYCEIRINAWLKYPELRKSFYFGRSVPIDTTEYSS